MRRIRPRGESAMKSPFYTAEHDAFREMMRRFVEKEITPFAHDRAPGKIH